MSTEQNKRALSSEEIVKDLISQLLAKPESDEELEIELFGYPADCLDDPREKHRPRLRNRFFESIDEEIPFVVMFMNGDDIQMGPAFNSDATMFSIEGPEGIKYISATKLQSLLYDHADKGYFTSSQRGDKFIIRLRVRLLIDNSDVF